MDASDGNEPSGIDHRYVWEVLDDLTDEVRVPLWFKLSVVVMLLL